MPSIAGTTSGWRPVRRVRFGERMILTPPSRWTGDNEEYREITWERIAAE